MSSDLISLAALKAAMTSTSQLVGLRLALMTKRDHATFIALVADAIDWIAQDLSRNPELLQNQKEDQLSLQVVRSLKQAGFLASHETKIGGHVDITVEYKFELLWLAEAKIYKGPAYLLGGFQQLNDRYATANPGQNAGGMIIYAFREHVDTMIDGWCSYLAANVSGLTTSKCTTNPLARLSVHDHHRTGLPYTVRHVPISLYWPHKVR